MINSKPDRSWIMQLKYEFGKRLRRRRRGLKLTQMDLAKLIGVRPITISNLERGKTSPTFEMMEKVSKALEISVRELFPET